jgi:P-type Mg2+ transporter
MNAANVTGTSAELLRQLETTSEGLTTDEAERRVAAQGLNEPARAHLRAAFRDLVRAAANPLNVILLLAAFASTTLGAPADATIIGTIVLLSTALNYWQVFRSERAMRALHSRLAPTATVKRDAKWTEIERRRLVAGDVIHLSAGDLVPADARLLQATDLHIQQSALTGESMPAEKRAHADALACGGPESAALVFLGTSVLSGTATAVVFATGSHTGFGGIVEELAERPEETDFERGMHRFSMLILRTVLFFVLFVLIVNIALGRDAFQSLLFSVALAVGLTPEFLPMITTVTLAQGALRMAREHVIVKHLPAIQNLGSIDILCTDKTGTLTAGAMSVEASLDATGAVSDRALHLASVNSHFQTGIRSPLDDAVAKACTGASLTTYRKTDEIPFDFERRRLSVVVADEEGYLLVAKGAPESVLAVCCACDRGEARVPLGEAQTRQCIDIFQALSAKGLRVLAIAYKRVPHADGFTAADERDLTFAGFVTFSDPMLEGVRECIAQLAQDGVRVKILSGDNELVARHVCTQAGLDVKRVVTGDEIESMDVAALSQVAETVDVFARLSPTQKYRIIRTLKARDHVVGFLGDGINDAPSLHTADVGISAAGATDIARESADIILLERRLDVLHAGIVAGRRSYGNVLKYLLMGTSSNFGNMFSMAAAAAWLPFLPMRPTQILLNNLLYDLAQLTIPTDNVDAALIRRPQRWNVRLIRSFMLIVGPVSSLYDFLTFYVLLYVFRFDEGLFQTGWFLESLATQTLVLFVIRTIARPWKDRPSLPLTITTLLVVLIGAALPYTPLASPLGLHPLPASYFVFLVLVTITYLAVVEIVKRRVMKRILGPTE